MFAATLLALSLAGQSSFDRVPLEGNAVFDDLGKSWVEMMETFHVTGFSVVAIKEGKVVLLDGVGDADPTNSRAANIDTRYYIASITKTMTATAIAQLAEQGKLDLDAPVQKYLPRFTLADAEFASSVTVRDLLCHKPGIRGGSVVLLDAYSGSITEDRYYKFLAESTPGKEIRYSNVHFTLLGRVIESVTGVHWREYLAANVFAPLGMDRTTGYMSATHDDPNFAIPLMPNAGGAAPSPYMKTDRTMHAAGGLLTTPRDMARYLTAWLNGGELDGNRFLKEETVKDALSHQSSFEPRARIRRISGCGYAWNVGDYRETKGFAAHGGGYTGYMSYIALLPGQDAAIAVFVNTGAVGGGFGTLLVVDMLDRLAGYPVDTDLREQYKGRAGRYSEGLRSRKPFGPNPALSGMLSLVPGAYEGEYYDELFGLVEISYSGGMLKLDWEDLPQMLKSTGMDEFTAHDREASSGTPGKFVVEGGKVVAIEIDFGGRAVVFRRV